jgi:hypothetical protein
MQSNTFRKMLYSFGAPQTDEYLGTIIVGKMVFEVMFGCQQNL